jgi:cytochrome c biogenesis protein CcdA/glutaredoxin
VRRPRLEPEVLVLVHRVGHATRPRRGAAAVVGVLLLLVWLAPAHAEGTVTLLYFGADGCPYCVQMETLLDELEERHGDDLRVERHEVSEDPVARQRWADELAARGHQASGVPTAVLGDRVWVGFDARVAADLETEVAAALARTSGPGEPGEAGASEVLPGPEAPEGETGPDGVVVPLIGEVQLTGRTPLGATALIAFVDGFNPCSLWVLTVLLAMVLHAGVSRRRVAAVGGTFLAVTGLIYGAFIVGLFTVMGFVAYLDGIRLAVAAVALFVGLVNVKDFFAYKRGLSFTIPDRFKPRIYRSGRAVRDRGRSLPAVLGTTVAMAAGISLVELPCTAGFPVIWTGMLRTQEVAGGQFAALLGLYLLVYVGIELVVFGVALITLRAVSLKEAHGRALKLVGGAVMIALGAVLVLAPQLMESFAGASLVVLGAVALALVLAAVQRFRGPGATRR